MDTTWYNSRASAWSWRHLESLRYVGMDNNIGQPMRLDLFNFYCMLWQGANSEVTLFSHSFVFFRSRDSGY